MLISFFQTLQLTSVKNCAMALVYFLSIGTVLAAYNVGVVHHANQKMKRREIAERMFTLPVLDYDDSKNKGSKAKNSSAA